MSKVLLELPITFAVQEFLLNWAKETKTPLSLIDSKTGLEIYERFVNTAEIGMTMKETPASGRKLGFATPATMVKVEEKIDPDDEGRPSFQHEAVLVLQEGQTWVLEVVNASDIDTYSEVAGALCRKFGVDIQMDPEYMDNPDVTE